MIWNQHYQDLSFSLDADDWKGMVKEHSTMITSQLIEEDYN